MKWLCTLLSAFLMTACGHAGAETTNTPTLSVEYLQADTVRVIARWSRPCDAKGCADAYAVRWTAGATTLRTRTTSTLADTVYPTRPAFGDSLLVTVGVTSWRRNVSGPTRTTTVVVRNPDAPPPAVDSLRADTLRSAALEAEIDSFPVLVVRTPLGTAVPRVWSLPVGDSAHLCVLGRNRYTGEIRTFVNADTPDAELDAIDRVCAPARAVYAKEGSG